MSSFSSAERLRQTATAAGWDPHRIRDGLLAVLAFAAGSIDVMSWLALGKVFCAFMTGNVVFLAAGLFEHQSELSLHAAVVLCAFVQLVFWVLWLAVDGHPGSTLMILLGASAFAMGIQTAAAVTLGVHAVFTTAVTATWTVLVGDAAHWSATGTERRRLTLVLAGTLLGALAGALLLAHLRLWMPLLPALLTASVVVAAHRTVEPYVDPTRTTVSAGVHPLDRAFGRSPDDPPPIPDGR
jgi:uncharacterized membrane protein YoaK (UPF0700 family)